MNDNEFFYNYMNLKSVNPTINLPVLEYIDTNYCEKIALSELAALL